MQNHNQQQPMNPDIWSWSNKQPKEMLYANLDINTSSFEFPILDNTYSSFHESDSWSATSSPISSSSQVPKSISKDTYPLSFSFRGGPNAQSIHKPKATKGERLEVRLSTHLSTQHKLTFPETAREKPHITETLSREKRKVYSRSREPVQKAPRKKRVPVCPSDQRWGANSN
jgi:hypothetical protein